MGMSILGLYNYDSSVFDDFILPENVEKDLAVSKICLHCAELDLLLTRPDTMREAVSVWSQAMQYRWETLAKTQEFEYDPISNYDRTETKTGRGTGTGSGNGNRKEKIAAFNALDVVNRSEENTTTGNTTTYNNSEETRTSGNIGVTTTQQMIKQERNISDFSIYNVIAEDFKKEFCIMVY